MFRCRFLEVVIDGLAERERRGLFRLQSRLFIDFGLWKFRRQAELAHDAVGGIQTHDGAPRARRSLRNGAANRVADGIAPGFDLSRAKREAVRPHTSSRGFHGLYGARAEVQSHYCSFSPQSLHACLVNRKRPR